MHHVMHYVLHYGMHHGMHDGMHYCMHHGMQEAAFDPATFDAAFPSLGICRPPPKLLVHCLPASFTDGQPGTCITQGIT